MVKTVKLDPSDDDADALLILNGHRYATVRVACRYGRFSPSRCFTLLNKHKIRGKRFDGRTLVELESIDEMYENLPDR